MKGYLFFSFNTVSAARVSNPSAPPVPKYRYPSFIYLITTCSKQAEISDSLSFGNVLCPVKQQVYLFKSKTNLKTKLPLLYQIAAFNSLSVVDVFMLAFVRKDLYSYV